MTSTAPATIRTIKTWDWGVRLFHWLLVAAIAVAFLSSEEGGALAPWRCCQSDANLSPLKVVVSG